MKKLSVILWLITTIVSFAQTIPISSRVDWSVTGLSVNPPSIVNTLNVTDFGIIGDNTTNNTLALNNLLNSITVGTPTVVYFPAGNYQFSSTIVLKDNVVLRGDCANNSRLYFNMLGNGYDCISVSKSQSSSYTPITAGFEKESTVLTVGNTASFTVGSFAEIRQQNGSWDAVPATWATYCVGQMVKVVAINGNQITINHPLRISYDLTLNPEIRPIVPIQFAGVENIYIERTDSGTPPGGNNIVFNYAANCWVRGIESNRSVSAHVALYQSTNVEITGSYFHHAIEYTGSNTKGYGIMFAQHTGECLVQDNIFKYLRHSISLKQGANGNVVAYNYSREGNRSEAISDYAADISIHGHYPFANLCEGNVMQFLQIDYTWGPAGPYNTFFRNELYTYGVVMSAATGGGQGSNKQNFVGNETTNNTFHIPFYGSYTITGSDHFQYGNNIVGSITPSGTNNLTTTSYYLINNSPNFWTLSANLPVIGPPNSNNTGSNPAEQRYLSGSNLTLSSPTIFGTNNICANGTSTYYVLDAVGTSYNWTVNGGTILLGQGTPTISVQWADVNGTIGVTKVNP